MESSASKMPPARQYAQMQTSQLLRSKRLAPKRSAKSKVWEYFGFRTDPNDENVIISTAKVACAVCDQLLTYSGNTSSMSSHLQAKHPCHFSSFSSSTNAASSPSASGIQSKPTLPSDADLSPSPGAVRPSDAAPSPAASTSQGSSTPSPGSRRPSRRHDNAGKRLKQPMDALIKKDGHYVSNSPRAKQLTQAVAYHLARDMKPIHTVKEAGFVHMLEMFDSQYSLPSTKTFSIAIIPQMYKSLWSNTVAPFIAGCTAYALTCEMWTGRNMSQFLGVTCHAIDSSWQLKSYTLENVECPPSPECIASRLAKVLKKWNIKEEQLSAIATDSASTKAVQDLGWGYLPCFGHCLSSLLGVGLEAQEVQSTLDRCSRLVGLVERSDDASFTFADEREVLDLPQNKPVQDVKTRLNAALDMLECFVEQQEAIRTRLHKLKRQQLMHSADELKTMEQLVDLLNPLKEMIEFFSGEYVTVSGLLPCLIRLERSLADDDDNTRPVAAVKQAMRAKLDMYRQDSVKETLQLCSFLDPRFKALPFLDSAEIAAVHQMATQTAVKLAEESTGAEKPASPSPEERPPKTSKMVSLFGEMYKAAKSTSLLGRDVRAADEVWSYVAEPSLDLDDDPLSWWKMNGARYQLLGRTAKKYLCIPATSVPSQRLFSSAGDIFRSKRSCLKPSNIHPLTFLHDNLSE